MGILSTALLRPQTYVGHAREAIAAARCAALYPLGLLERALTTGDANGDEAHDRPVLLVHGYGHNRSGWFGLERGLRQAGFTSVHSMNYVAWGRDGVPELAAMLARRVEAIRTLTGADKVHIVGHSLGGVLIRWYVEQLGGDRFVDTAITIASPHWGTVTAFGAPGPCARDLRPGSLVMRTLRRSRSATWPGASTSPDVRWMAFYTNLDLFVQPARSAMLPGAENVLVKDVGHVGIMVSPVVVRRVVAALSSLSVNQVVAAPPHAPKADAAASDAAAAAA